MSESKDAELVLAAPTRLARDFSLLPSTLGEAREMAEMIANSEFAPKDYKGKWQSVLIAVQMGADVGLRPMQSLQNIAVINGRPSIWGDGALALTMSLFEKFEERFEGTYPENDFTAICTIRRRGWPTDTVQRFSIGDAKHADLWNKPGPWKNYPKRMLQMRCRSWALRDAAADRLMGLILAEEAMDIPEEPQHVGSGSTARAAEPQNAIERLPEALRDKIAEAFAAINLSPGLGRAKLNEFLLADGVDLEDGAANLLDWCREEFAKQKTGKPRAKKGDGNGKPVPESVKASETKGARDVDAADTGGVEPARAGGVEPAGAVDTGHAGPSAAVTAAAKTLNPLGSPTLSGPPAAVKPNDDSLF